MRIRVITQTFTDLWRHRSMMNPFRSGFYAVQLISHEVLRYLAPFCLIVMLFASGILASASRFFMVMFFAQVLFYTAAAASRLFEQAGQRSKLLALPQYFVLTNLATVLALYKFVRGER